MNSTPKQQDGDQGGVEPASGARPSLEQTVLGVAPASSSASALPTAAVPPPPIDPAPLDLAPSEPRPASEAAAAAGPPVLAAPVIVVSAPGAAERAVPREPAHPPHLHAAAASPGLPVHGTLPVTAPPPVAAHEPARHAPVHGAVDVTLPVGVASSQAAIPATPQRVAGSVDAGLQRTALSEDYLREARQAALDAVARSSVQPPAPVSGTDPFAATASADPHEPSPASFGTRPSIAAPLPHGAPSSSAVSAAPVVTSRGFEPVPIPRAPLAESLSGNLGPVADVGGLRNGAAPSSARARSPLPVQRSGDAVLRWLLLAAVALVSIASVMVGQRIWHRYQESEGRPLAVAAAPSGSPSDTSTERALLSNRPAVDVPPPGRALVVSASHPQPGEGSGPSPESQLAATAGRHVLAGNYAEALPVYQQLERAFPENTAYAAMSRLLKEKVGTSSDAPAVAPAPASKGKKK